MKRYWKSIHYEKWFLPLKFYFLPVPHPVTILIRLLTLSVLFFYVLVNHEYGHYFYITFHCFIFHCVVFPLRFQISCYLSLPMVRQYSLCLSDYSPFLMRHICMFEYKCTEARTYDFYIIAFLEYQGNLVTVKN